MSSASESLVLHACLSHRYVSRHTDVRGRRILERFKKMINSIYFNPFQYVQRKWRRWIHRF